MTTYIEKNSLTNKKTNTLFQDILILRIRIILMNKEMNPILREIKQLLVVFIMYVQFIEKQYAKIEKMGVVFAKLARQIVLINIATEDRT